MNFAVWIVTLILLLTTDCLPKAEDITTTEFLEFEFTTTDEEYITTDSSSEQSSLSEETVLSKTNSLEINDDKVNELEDFIQEVLETHNEYRAVHKVQPLQLKDELNEKAQAWANHLAETDEIENSLSEYAENIYAESLGPQLNGTVPVKFWYDKIEFYTPGKLTNDFWKAAPFTQIIWAKTKYLGVGMAVGKVFKFVVCFYDPPGNTIGLDPLDDSDDFPELPMDKSFFILPGGIFTEGNENENLTKPVLEKFIEQVLEEHNKFRFMHGVPPLQIKEELNTESQAWADHLAAKDMFYHSNTSNGENIYKEPAYFDRRGSVPVKFWYDEIEQYKFGKEPENWFKVGHFTQLIWSDTKYLGVGLTENGDTRYVVCNYSPRGNVINQSHYEKLIPPIEHENNSIEEASPVVAPEIIQDHKNISKTKLEAFRQEVLSAHNDFRVLHGVHPLELKNELNKVSQERAESLATNNLLGFNSSRYGENIFADQAGQDIHGSVPVKHWYDEVTFYTFGKEPEDWQKVGHFTQVVWSNSKYLGVGLAENEEFTFIVCSYDPMGNIVGLPDYTELLPPIGGISNILEDPIQDNNTTEDDNEKLYDNNVSNNAETSDDEKRILEKLEAILNELTQRKNQIKNKDEILDKVNAIAEVIKNPIENISNTKLPVEVF